MGFNFRFVRQVACMQLINAIVSTPDDLDFRLHLRNELMRSGLIDALEVGIFTLSAQIPTCKNKYLPAVSQHEPTKAQKSVVSLPSLSHDRESGRCLVCMVRKPILPADLRQGHQRSRVATVVYSSGRARRSRDRLMESCLCHHHCHAGGPTTHSADPPLG